MSGTISSVTFKPDLRAANRPSNQKSSYPHSLRIFMIVSHIAVR